MTVKRQTTLSGNILQLCRYLRARGFVIGVNDEADAMNALTCIPLGDKASFKAALKALLAKSKWQYAHFDDLFTEFWDELKRAVD